MDQKKSVMKILVLCTKFSLSENDPWLTNELAESLQESGNEVTVVCLDWSAEVGSRTIVFTTTNGVKVVYLSPILISLPFPLLAKLMKWGLSSFIAYQHVRRLIRGDDFNMVLSFSPAVTMALPILKMTRNTKIISCLFQWDFFPYHHRQIGLIPFRWVFTISRKLEEMLIRRFDVVACMSPANVKYLRTHYALRDSQNVTILPIWGKNSPLPDIDREAIRKEYGLPTQKPLIVFGGQLVLGRGLEDLLAAARLASESGGAVVFVVIGSGPLESLVTEYLEQDHGNLVWIPRVPRQEYLSVIKSCDLALVCTVRDVDVPSFPSKTIDYLRVGLPIVASVEKSTDYGEYITAQGVGVSVDAGEPEALLSAIQNLLDNSDKMGQMSTRGPICFNEVFEVKRTVAALRELVTSNKHVV